jgi:signal transduction histidine kinase
MLSLAPLVQESNSEMKTINLIREIGGKDLLNIKDLLVWLPIPLITLSMATSTAKSGDVMLVWILSNLITLALMATLVFLLRLLIYQRRPALVLSVFWVVVIAASLGGIKSLTTFITVGALIDIPQTLGGYIFRAAGGCVVGVLTISGLALWGHLTRTLEYEGQLLMASKSYEYPIALTNSERSSLFLIRDELKGLSYNLTINNHAEFLSPSQVEQIEKLASANIRSLSNLLYEPLIKRSTLSIPAGVVNKAMRTRPSEKILALCYLGAIWGNVAAHGLAFGVILTASSALLIYSTLTLTFKLLERFRLINPFSFVAATAFVPSAAVVFVNLWHEHIHPAWLIFVTVGVWFSSLSIINNSIKVARRDLDALRKESANFQTLGNSAAFELRRNKIARLLHGEVQSRLQAAVRKGGPEAGLSSAEACLEIGEIMDLLDSHINPQNLTPLEQIQRLIKRWRGFAEIDIDLPKTIPAEIDLNQTFDIIEEAVTNAVRHGFANHIAVKVSLEPERSLSVIDNGFGPIAGAPSIGSKILDSRSKSWKLSAVPGGGSKLLVLLK